MNSALPRPHPARKSMMPLMLPAVPANAAKTTISTSPVIRVRLAPIRLDTHPVTSIMTAVTTR